jgi:hypothetical protein
MPKRNVSKPAKRGGRDLVVSARLPRRLVADIDEWAAANGVAREEAIRLLVERGLSDPLTLAARWLAGGGRPSKE